MNHKNDGEVPRKKVVILGGGPNRIGQGIEFDYCCVQAAFALKEEGYQVIMINCNPETVSTDYDTSDRLYFEPLTMEDVLNIWEKEKPWGVIVQFGGQTPLNIATDLMKEGVPIIGTSPDSIDRAEDRERFSRLITHLNLLQAPNGTARSFEEARKIAKTIGYPVLVRPSYVLGGRAMEIVYDEMSLEQYINTAVEVSLAHPVLVDKFIEEAIEVDIDAVADGQRCFVGGIMEHIEEAGVHSGDSSCSLPPYTLSRTIVQRLKKQTYVLARELKVVGLINIQFAIKNDQIYILEVNPRASRTVPFVGKTTGVPLAKIATKIMVGRTLRELGYTREKKISHIAVKEAVFPFIRFPGVDIILGPEMRSTGEVMGISNNFGTAFAKAQMGAGLPLPLKGTVFISVANKDKPSIVSLAREMAALGFNLVATRGTTSVLRKNGIKVKTIKKIKEGRPNVADYIRNGEIDLIFNTPIGKGPKFDEYKIRQQATLHRIPIITTIPGARAAVDGIKALKGGKFSIKSLQDYHKEVKPQHLT